MKIFMALFLFVVMQMQGVAHAGALTSTDGAGVPGGTASLTVSFSGDITNGGEFSIGFNPSQLTLTSAGIVGPTGFSAVADNTFGPWLVSLTNDSATDPVDGAIFSIQFKIVDPFPDVLPGTALVDIGGFVYGATYLIDGATDLALIHPTIHVNAGQSAVPEPGALLLVALALLIMAAVHHRRLALARR